MKLAIAIALLVSTASSARAERIKQIDVVENSKTTDDTVLLIADIEKGDDWKPEMAERIERALVNSGLFKVVDVFSQPVAGGVHVTIVAKDKHSWVIAPTLYNQPTNKGGGIGFGENNLGGTNKKLLLYGQVATGDTFFIGAYVDPSIGGSVFHWQFDTFLRRERVFEYEVPKDWIGDTEQVRQSKLNYFNGGALIGIDLFGGLKFDVRGRAAYLFYDQTKLVEGACLEDVVPGLPEGGCTLPADDSEVPEPGAEGWDMSAEAILVYDNTANWYGIFSGDRYKLTYEKALPQVGSDFDYWYATAEWVRARKFYERHNWIIKSGFNYSHNVPFQHEWTAGGPDHRGLKNRQLRGNIKASATFEYSVPVFTLKGFSFRAQAFADSAYTAFVNTDGVAAKRNYLPDHEHKGLSPWKNTVGLGTRLYVRQIVLPLLGLDFGYGLERRALEMYFAIGLTAF